MDYLLTWYKCFLHSDDVQWPWLRSIPQRSRSHKTFKGQSTHARAQAITYVCMDGLPSNLEQMLSPLKCDNIFITSVFSSKAVKQCIENTLKACYFIDVTNQGLIFLLFLAKITLTLILPTLHTIWITLTNILL